MSTIVLLILSSAFKTVAWYWFLRPAGTDLPLRWVVLVSWAIALVEYGLLVPANHFGSTRHGGPFTPAQLFVLADGIGVLLFLGFTIVVLEQPPRWPEWLGMGLILSGIAVAMLGRTAPGP